MRFLSFLFIIVGLNNAWAIEQVVQQINSQVTLQKKSGEVLNLERNNFIRMKQPITNLSSWYQEVEVVDDDGAVVDDEKFKVSQKYLFKAISDQIDTSLPLIDTKRGLPFKTPEGTRFVVLEKDNSKHPQYSLVMVNEEGEVLSKKGEPITAMIDGNSIYKIDAHVYEEALIKSKLETMSSLQFEVAKATKPPCAPCLGGQLTSSERPVKKPARKPAGTAVTDPNLSPYKKLMDYRNSIKGKKNCQSLLRKKEAELLEETDWAGLSLKQRAEKINVMSKDVMGEIKKEAKTSSGNLNKDLFNPNVIHPLMTPDLVSCISYQETRGLLNPINMNYTYCNNTKGLISTAHGLHHVVKRTFNWLKTHPEGDMIPMTTKYSTPYSDLTPTDLHVASSSSPEVQLEIMIRVMNFNLKHQNWINRGKLTNDQLLRKAIIAYDQDSQSSYIKNVIDRCLPCMKKTKSSSEAPGCYETLQ